MSIEHGDKTYFAADETVSGGISSGQPSDDIEEGDVYNALTEEEAKILIERLAERAELLKDEGFMKFLLGKKIVDTALGKINQELRPNIDIDIKRKQKELKFWIDIVSKVPFTQAIRRDREAAQWFADVAGNINVVTKSLKEKVENGQELSEEDKKLVQATGLRVTIDEGMAFGLVRIENQMSKGDVLTDQQIDKLDKIRKISLEELDSIKDLIPEEKE